MGQSFYPNDCRHSKRRGFEHLQVTKFFQIQTDSSSMLRVIKLLVYLDWEIMNVLMENIAFGEGPHWKNGNLWFSDMHSQQVIKLAPTGSWEIVVALQDDQPSGLGWLPDGDLLIVSMQKRQILRFNGKDLLVHADLSQMANYHATTW
ncbi:MAG: hypothetical protein CMK43_01440 [Porticoccaceae bacterium]|nr:hypothetical protein [Porticoccaceae bacterium]